MTSYQKKTEKQKERAEILFKEYPGIHMAYGLSETKKEGVSKFSPSFFMPKAPTFTSWGFVIT